MTVTQFWWPSLSLAAPSSPQFLLVTSSLSSPTSLHLLLHFSFSKIRENTRLLLSYGDTNSGEMLCQIRLLVTTPSSSFRLHLRQLEMAIDAAGCPPPTWYDFLDEILQFVTSTPANDSPSIYDIWAQAV
ncbi:unnamed protein product [Arabis nemorensis]|uniref:Uncharacterized protein n=1 Tax=Arabis nemorensis TaxID=586526 RepID=A0A565BWY2_9BRAS|nr:unnamed protein product [Arabis nemorensis]